MAGGDKGFALLIIIGEPMSEDHVAAIYQRIIEGLSAFDSGKCPINVCSALESFIDKNVEAEPIESGGTVLRSTEQSLYIEFLVSPGLQTVHSSLTHLMTYSAIYRHIVFAGPTFLHTGSWILRDGTFSVHDFARIMHRVDVVTALMEITPASTVSVSCFPEGEWTEQGVKNHGLDQYGNVTLGILNGAANIDSYCVSALQKYLEQFVEFVPLQTLMPPSELVGSIRFRRPTIYIFPAGQGNATLFGFDGFLMLFDGGFQRKTCYWDFLRHVDYLDALLISGVNTGNLFGMASLVDTLASSRCYPKIGHIFGTVSDVGKTATVQEAKNPLLISLYDEGGKIFERLARLSLRPQACAYVPPPVMAKYPDSIVLYEKVGQGRLEMYVMNPVKESKEYADFVETWRKRAPKYVGTRFTTKPGSDSADFYAPLVNRSSMAVLIVWRPSDPDQRIIRIMLPGSCPQDRLLAGAEKLRSLDFLKYPYCTIAIMEKKPTGLMGMRAAMLTKKPSVGKTAAELLAEAAKLNATTPTAALASVLSPMIRRKSAAMLASPISPTRDQSQDSDLEDGGAKDENSNESSLTPVDPRRSNHAGFAVEAEPARACTYESVEREMERRHACAEEGGNRRSGTIRISIKPPESEARHIESPSSPNSQPFYQRRGYSADSSRERRQCVIGDSQMSPVQVEAVGHGWRDHHRNINEIRTEWGDPLGLPTTPAKKTAAATAKTSKAKSSPAKGVTGTARSPKTAPVTATAATSASTTAAATITMASSKRDTKRSKVVPHLTKMANAAKKATTKPAANSVKEGLDNKTTTKAPVAVPAPAQQPAPVSATSKYNVALKPSDNESVAKDNAPVTIVKPTTTKESTEASIITKPQETTAPSKGNPTAAASTEPPALVKPTTLSVSSAVDAKPGIGRSSLRRQPSALLRTPIYVDLACFADPKCHCHFQCVSESVNSHFRYVPHQANPYYCNIEFFKFIRAKYYVYSALNPPKESFDALLAGKRTWMTPDESVTIIPTYDSDTLSLWMETRKDDLSFENIDVAPACTRCSVNLEEHEGAACAAYRLEL